MKVTIIEPGGFRTDGGGASMSHIEPREEYQDTVGKFGSNGPIGSSTDYEG
ncbi:hypothetical protein [Paenibacillus sp. N3.4]|uniref:hypothetical protein n=1 Tax=Paenibacillus sp. N3.4 TaxID=2603222 RepID=UPI001C9D57EE|nr:hypothetical protein [Paenibacillus sp. N3.4]